MIFMTIKPLILASHSPRRQDFFRDLGLTFKIRGAAIDEQPLPGELATDYVRRVAREKAEGVQQLSPLSYVVAADTAVCLGEQILGKPRDEQEAVEMLLALAGRAHVVRTGFCICCEADAVREVLDVATTVYFADFTKQVARAYVNQGESLDKAGAYGIQGKGAFLVKRIEGSYSNVVGLPLAEVLQVLVQCGAVAPAGA